MDLHLKLQALRVDQQRVEGKADKALQQSAEAIDLGRQNQREIERLHQHNEAQDEVLITSKAILAEIKLYMADWVALAHDRRGRSWLIERVSTIAKFTTVLTAAAGAVYGLFLGAVELASKL